MITKGVLERVPEWNPEVAYAYRFNLHKAARPLGTGSQGKNPGLSESVLAARRSHPRQLFVVLLHRSSPGRLPIPRPAPVGWMSVLPDTLRSGSSTLGRSPSGGS